MTSELRSEFDIPRDVCYLNASYMTPQPIRVRKAAEQGALQRAEPWAVKPPDFFSNVEALRSEFAKLTAGAANNISIIPAVSYGIATAARNLPLGAGESILLLKDQFPSNYYSWQRLAAESGGRLDIVSPGDGQSWTDAVLARLDDPHARTRIISIPNHHWASAEVIDVGKICRRSHELGISVVLDLSQTLGACPVDIKALDPDFVITAGYKWLFCPYGLSFMYVADRRLGGVPIEESWANRHGSEDFAQLAAYTDDYQHGARRFDIGERASFSNIAGGLEAMRTLNEWGVERIRETIADTNRRIAEIARDCGLEPQSGEVRAPHFQCVSMAGRDTTAITASLSEKKVFVSPRGDYVRISPHVYNDEQDLERLRQVLAEGL